MKGELLHVFRNTPYGREILERSIHACRLSGRKLAIYLPESPRFLMYFEGAIATVNLDREFLRNREGARDYLEGALGREGIEWRLLEIRSYTRKVLPEIPTDFDFMTCPRSLTDLSTRIGLGYLGPRVREIVAQASFPVFIPGQTSSPWREIACFYGGSEHSARALRIALDLAERGAVPLRVWTLDEGPGEDGYRTLLERQGLHAPLHLGRGRWGFLSGSDLRDSLNVIGGEALVVCGAFGHSKARELFFGSFAETLQTVLPNTLLLVGPKVRTS